MKHAVVIHDSKRELFEGEILSGNAVGVAVARGVVVLPVEVDLLRRSGLSGWSKRSYGRGWKYDAIAASRGCPLVIHVAPQFPILEWRARLVVDGDGPPHGALRFAADTASVNASATGIMPETGAVQMADLGAPDADGGWFIGGRGRASIPADLSLALQLYGQVGGARVSWFAVSQTR
jgi:hypothetical protein